MTLHVINLVLVSLLKLSTIGHHLLVQKLCASRYKKRRYNKRCRKSELKVERYVTAALA